MKESLDSTFLYNIVIIFIVVVFGILAATLTYYKAFKVNTRIINSIEKYKGYNGLATSEINNTLTTIGYMNKGNHKCPTTKNGGTLEPESQDFRYCVYYFDEDDSHYSYGVITYITLDIPIVNMFVQIPIYTRSNLIYRFNG